MVYKINKKGFTLMELIVTVILVAILASYAVYHYTNVMDEGKVNGAKGKLAALGGATARFILENGTPENFAGPSTDEQLISNLDLNDPCDTNKIAGVFTCGYAGKNVGFDSNFEFTFADKPCGSSEGAVRVMMKPNSENEDNSNFPKCAYFNPDFDNVIEVNE